MATETNNIDFYTVIYKFSIKLQSTCLKIIDNEVFQTHEYIEIMGNNTYVADITKRLVRMMKATYVNLGRVQIKKIQALIWRNYSFNNHDIELYKDVLMPGIIRNTIDNKITLILKTINDTAVKDIYMFGHNNYNIREYVLLNMLL